MAELSSRLVELVIGTPSHKVLLTELPKLYREKYKEDLDYQGRGFKKLGLLTDAAEGVEREGNFLVSSDRVPSFAGCWSSEPTWSAPACELIVEKFKEAEHLHSAHCQFGPECTRPFCLLDVKATPWNVRYELNELEGGLLELGHKRDAIERVVRQLLKGAAHLNKERL